MKEPYLMLFVYEYINEIKLLVTRHKNYLNQNRSEIKNGLYAHLDLPIFRALIREDNDVDAAPIIAAVDDASGDISPSASSSSAIIFDRRNSFPASVLSSSTNDEIVDKLRSIRETAYNLRQQEKKLNGVQNLCLNHIYFVSSRRNKSVGQYMSFNQHASLLSLETVALPRVPSSIGSLVKKLEDATANLHVFYKDTVDEMETIVAKSIIGLQSHLDIVIPSARQNPMTIFRSAKQANNGVQKSDFVLSVCTSEGEKLNKYQMKAKTPKANNGNLNFDKLAKNIKVMADELVSRGCPLEAACSYGTLIHGH